MYTLPKHIINNEIMKRLKGKNKQRAQNAQQKRLYYPGTRNVINEGDVVLYQNMKN